jgi:long-chain fatty acid transport protein
MHKFSGVLSFAALAVMLACAGEAQAVNAHQFTGNGSVQESMSGAGTAAPLDSATILLNPAGLVRVPNRLDFGVVIGIPVAHIDTSAAPLGNAAAGKQENELEPFPIPAISASFELIKERLALGIGLFGVAGNAFSFKNSRLNPAITGNAYDRYIDYRLFKFTPAISYAILDNLSIGAALHADYAIFGTDSAVGSTLAETAGGGRSENTIGFGGSFGILYSPLKQFSLGVCYTSRQIFPTLKKYSDFLKTSLDMPHQLKFGVAGTLFDRWLIAADFHWINWSGITAYGAAPSEGGLGWKDQYIADVGTQVSVGPRKMVHLRAGYGYGSPPISDNVLFANTLMPLITKHNATFGIGVDLNDHWTLNTHFGINIINHMTESGTGDAVSKAGAGTKTDFMVYAGSFGLAYRWGEAAPAQEPASLETSAAPLSP